MSSSVYIVDNDYLVDLTINYSPKHHVSFWKKVQELKLSDRFVTHRHVEIEYTHADSKADVFDKMRIFDFNERLLEVYKEVVASCENKWKWEPKSPVADHALVSLALYLKELDPERDYRLLTLEQKVPESNKNLIKLVELCDIWKVPTSRRKLAELESWVI